MSGPTYQPDTVTAQRIEATYREALDLALQARAYIRDRAGEPVARDAGAAELVYAAETMRMSSRIMHVVAWAMHRKAMTAGELEENDMRAVERRLGGETVCRAAPAGDLRLLPDAVQEMVAASCDLYERAARLEGMLDRADEDAAATNTEPAVHRLWREISDFDGRA